MKTLIVCKSMHHNNTLKVAQAIGAVLSANLITPQQFTTEILDNYDIIGFGSGIYAGKHHDDLLKLFNYFQHINKPVFIFSTRAIAALHFYHKLLKNRIKTAGCIFLGEFSCTGYSTYGPLKFIGGVNKKHPSDEDINNARIFAKKIQDTYQSLQK